jgi:predicted nucleotidyltransferase
MESRKKVAIEAARLLYFGDTKEYKQAKDMASRNLGVSTRPSNFEVALELDNLSDQMEGIARQELLLEMRQLALKLMKVLANYYPVLEGSVWRGTSRNGSDIDINVYSNLPDDVESKLMIHGYSIEDSKEEAVVHRGELSRSKHIITYLNGIKTEIIVRPQEERGKKQRCEIYRDIRKGLTLPELEKLMKTDPLRKFVPRRRYK